MTPLVATYWLWGVWYASWLVAAFWAKRATARPSWRAFAGFQLPTMAGLLCLFFVRTGRTSLTTPLWPVPPALSWTLFVAAGGGFALCWWARLTLGALWSGWVSRTAEHRVIDTGPYAVVRHPIYTGVILAAAATAAQKATAVALVGVALIALALFIKARVEESFLSAELGADAYADYRRRIPMLVPFAPR